MLAYLVAANLPKEKFIRTVSTMYFIGSFPLYGSLIYYGFATKQDLIVSVALIIPAFIAQQLGTKIRVKSIKNSLEFVSNATYLVKFFSFNKNIVDR